MANEDWDRSPVEQQQAIWTKIEAHLESDTNVTRSDWPSYDQVVTDLTNADYTDTIHCPFDYRAQRPKAPTLCPLGVACCVTLEVFPDSPYTGLLAEGHHPGILRISSALPPPSSAVSTKLGKALLFALGGRKLRTAQLFPCAALKLFRTGRPSGNLLCAGSKLGQRERNFFRHAVCTSMTEQMPRAVRPLVQKFWEYSDFPLSLGVSDVCSQPVTENDDEGESNNNSNNVVFPFAVVLYPHESLRTTAADSAATTDTATTDAWTVCVRDVVPTIAADTLLYDVFVCPDPARGRLQRIGVVRTTSTFCPCNTSGQLFFRHQLKEDDYAMQPHWRVAIRETTVSMNDGKTQGTMGTLAGWKLFEQQIERHDYDDFGPSSTLG